MVQKLPYIKTVQMDLRVMLAHTIPNYELRRGFEYPHKPLNMPAQLRANEGGLAEKAGSPVY